MENWCWSASLWTVARHYETGVRFHKICTRRWCAHSNFPRGEWPERQLSFGTVDLALHAIRPARDGDLIAYNTTHSARFPRTFPETCNDRQLYALIRESGWVMARILFVQMAEVLDADAFTRFRREGVFSDTVGREFET